jgi:glycosyltransferase involved in cell wall biosynthesis
VACGNEVRIDIERWAPRAANVVTIGNGVNLTEASGPEQRARVRSQWGLTPEDIAIGYLGRMHEEKGPHLLLEAFLSRFGTPASRAHLILVGAGPMDAQLRERARGFSNVHFLGEVAVGASRLLAGLDIYAQASLREGRSLSMLEAMAASLPTVAHQLPAVAEIHSEETARLVPLGDTDKLGAALASLAEDEGLRKKMGQAAQKRVQAYSIDSTVAAYVDLYRKACGKA